MIQALIGPIANLASSWMDSKVEKVKADGQAKVAQAKAKAVVAEKVATGEVEWEKSMADATDSSCLVSLQSSHAVSLNMDGYTHLCRIQCIRSETIVVPSCHYIN